MKKVCLITDGSCLGNPGPGGWACLLRFGGVKKEFFGFDPRTTNNRMELMAAIQGLLALKEACGVEIMTDSQYVLYGATKLIVHWKRRHWWRKHSPVRNADLWMELDELASQHKTAWVWTRGHGGHHLDPRSDARPGETLEGRLRLPCRGKPGRKHATLRLDLGVDYAPPKPQAGLFDSAEPGGEEDEDDEDAVPKRGPCVS